MSLKTNFKCSVCDKKALSLGLCSQHYNQYKFKGQHRLDVLLWEQNKQCTPPTFKTYMRRVYRLTANTGADRKLVTAFRETMEAAYNGGSHE